MNSSSDEHCVNDLLYYVNFKRKTTALNDVVATCEAFYSPDAILNAKKCFFTDIGEHEGLKFSARRGPNPAKSNLEDLINAMNKCDNDGIHVPKFLSSDLSNVPQNNDGNVSLNQLLYMIVGMKQQLSNLENKQCVCASPSVPSEAPISSLISAPAQLSLSLAESVITEPPILDSATAEPIVSDTFALTTSSTDSATNAMTKSSFVSIVTNPPSSTSNRISPSALKNALQVALPVPNSGSGHNAKQMKRTAEIRVKTSHDKNRNIVIGKKPSSGAMSWGGAPLTIDCYIGRVDCSVTSNQIRTDVLAMGIDVVDIEENQTRHGLFKSFKLVVKKTDFATLNSPEIWPEGVVFRRFRRPRPPNTGHDNLPSSN